MKKHMWAYRSLYTAPTHYCSDELHHRRSLGIPQPLGISRAIIMAPKKKTFWKHLSRNACASFLTLFRRLPSGFSFLVYCKCLENSCATRWPRSHKLRGSI